MMGILDTVSPLSYRNTMGGRIEIANGSRKRNEMIQPVTCRTALMVLLWTSDCCSDGNMLFGGNFEAFQKC